MTEDGNANGNLELRAPFLASARRFEAVIAIAVGKPVYISRLQWLTVAGCWYQVSRRRLPIIFLVYILRARDVDTFKVVTRSIPSRMITISLLHCIPLV